MNYFFKRIVFFTVIQLTFVIIGTAQNAELSTADSLFNVKKYTEAFEKYEQIYDQGQASSAMLTRMAFIQEGLGNYADALYYLSLYYYETSDKAALLKMRDLAEEHNLNGYEYSDTKFIVNTVRQYQLEIFLVLIAFSIFLFAYGYSKYRKQEKPLISLGVQVITLALIGLLSNNVFLEKSAVITSDQALLMTGPSAGAEPVDYLDRGNKVKLIKSDPLWSQIQWGEDIVFVRTKNIKSL
ncbi:MAG: hypothetical protein JXR10_00365 [Cyclobacteriaceae bacterium]